MGQQQLLLLVLSAIIVGITIVVSFNMFGASNYQSHREAVLEEAVTIASRANEYYVRPRLLDGGNRSFNGVSLLKLGYADSSANGTFSIVGNGREATVTAEGKEDGDGDGNPLKFTIKVFPDSVGTPEFTTQ